MRFEAGGAFIVGLMVSACAVVGPLSNPRMTDAPNAACASVAAPAADRQCFVLAEQLPDGSRRAWSGGALQAGQVLLAVHRGGEGCTGTFTHLTVVANSPAAGRAELASWDLHGRPGHSRVVRWDQGFANRTFALADIGSTLMNPAGARITVQQGTFDPRQICFKSY